MIYSLRALLRGRSWTWWVVVVLVCFSLHLFWQSSFGAEEPNRARADSTTSILQASAPSAPAAGERIPGSTGRRTGSAGRTDQVPAPSNGPVDSSRLIKDSPSAANLVDDERRAGNDDSVANLVAPVEQDSTDRNDEQPLIPTVDEMLPPSSDDVDDLVPAAPTYSLPSDLPSHRAALLARLACFAHAPMLAGRAADDPVPAADCARLMTVPISQWTGDTRDDAAQERDFFARWQPRAVTRFCKPAAARTSPRLAHLGNRTFYIALNLYNSVDVLPDLTTTLISLLAHVEPARVFVGIYENGSADDTKSMLRGVATLLRALRISHAVILEDRTKPRWVHRIEYLADVRNRALAPLLALTMPDGPPAWPFDQSATEFLVAVYDAHGRVISNDLVHSPLPKPWTVDRILFLNDVYACVDEVVEAMHQSVMQNALLTCGIDYDRPPNSGTPQFYDTWVARGLDGAPWRKADGDGLFDAVQFPDVMRRVRAQQPFPTFCCWNGGAILDAAPIVSRAVKFRRNTTPNQCSASECSTLCRDLAAYARDNAAREGEQVRVRALVVPRLKVAYTEQDFTALKDLAQPMVSVYGLRPSYLEPVNREEDEMVEFQPPPSTAFCQPMYGAGVRDPDGQPFYEDLRDLRGPDVPDSGPAVTRTAAAASWSAPPWPVNATWAGNSTWAGNATAAWNATLAHNATKLDKTAARDEDTAWTGNTRAKDGYIVENGVTS
ncbi:capsular-associated protein [Allomyces macrogynus ATCC 38327]|uniref:Capsular-associated protein n=1 Tax=Allomyces macrogynus (strain ATCC 38327) TaxID=578462 RepID=A0A0L0RYI0_ALLM3|nr:capsular-associated protein [Allomyces macrogynus ATCC 38327]|eukprot:KNE55116.1 capsular-associated protein [Allomyces macrogynus ATCC 38327]